MDRTHDIPDSYTMHLDARRARGEMQAELLVKLAKGIARGSTRMWESVKRRLRPRSAAEV